MAKFYKILNENESKSKFIEAEERLSERFLGLLKNLGFSRSILDGSASLRQLGLFAFDCSLADIAYFFKF